MGYEVCFLFTSEVDRRVHSVIGYWHLYETMFAVSQSRKTYLASDDGGHSWLTVQTNVRLSTTSLLMKSLLRAINVVGLLLYLETFFGDHFLFKKLSGLVDFCHFLLIELFNWFNHIDQSVSGSLFNHNLLITFSLFMLQG